MSGAVETVKFELLNNAGVSFGGLYDVRIQEESEKWWIGINIDRTSEELVFDVELQPDTWLAVGLAQDLKEADVI